MDKLRNLFAKKSRPSRSSESWESGQESPTSTATHSNDDLAHPKERIKVDIICPSGKFLTFQTDTSKRLIELKNEAILEFGDDSASMPLFAADPRQLGARFRLIRANFDASELNESQTLDELKIENNETLLMLERRNVLQQYLTKIRENHGPTEREIKEATLNVRAKNIKLQIMDLNEIFHQTNLQFDVRKVLISMANASAVVLGAGPYGNRLVAMLKDKLINNRNYQQNTLDCLVDMGFKRELAEYALTISHDDYSNALEWLLMRQSDEPPPEAAMSMQKSDSVLTPSNIVIDDQTAATNTEALLQIVRIYSHRIIPPTQEAISKLVEMGFAEKDVLYALKKTCNCVAAACEYLCGNRTDSLIELREGLSKDSPVLKLILELPQVQLGLGNPKVFLAFLTILKQESAISGFLSGENDTSDVVRQILQKYHEEKHVMGLNQFYGLP